MLSRLLLILSLFSSLSLTAQLDSIGEWRSLQSYRYGTYMTESENSIIYTTGRAIFSLDKDDLSITTLAKEDGLAEARISIVRFHAPTETLIIVYESGVIDLLRNNQFTTLRQIDNFNFNGDKNIYSLFFGEENVVYFSAGFGVTALDLNSETFLFTTFTGVRVNGSAEYRGFLYAATEEGLYRVPREANFNDFGNWELLGESAGFPGDYSSTAITVFKDGLYFGVDKDVYRLNDADQPELHYDADDSKSWRLLYLTAGPNLMLGGYLCIGECQDRQIAAMDEAGIRREITQCIFLTNYAIEDDRGRIWIGEDEIVREIRVFESLDQFTCDRLEYFGPPTDRSYRLLHDGTSLWVAPGVLDANFSPSFDFQGVYRFKDNAWSEFSNDNILAFQGQDGARGGNDDVATIVDVAYDPIARRHFFSSFFEGLIRFDEETETGEIFDESNSTLTQAIGEFTGRVRVAGVVTDRQGFNYVANSVPQDDAIISVRSPEGEWADLGQGCGINNALAVEIDDNGFIWVVHATSVGGGLTVLDPMGTPMDPSDDRCRTITASNSNLPTNNVRSIAVDLGGVVWVGTSEGIILFECGSTVFDADNCRGRLPVATADDFGGFLLQTEEILSITVDGGNRKWIGTGGGAFLLSDNGEEQLLFFDEGNSPLLDNLVRDIAIHPATGVVYFGTELGIISLRSAATTATRNFAEELTIFPNPVEPGFAGPIAIQGLARDARVKITDLSGKLVDEGTAIGGQYTWNGADYTGRRVQSGVYLVFASSNARFSGTDPGSAVGKIVFIK